MKDALIGIGVGVLALAVGALAYGGMTLILAIPPSEHTLDRAEIQWATWVLAIVVLVVGSDIASAIRDRREGTRREVNP